MNLRTKILLVTTLPLLFQIFVLFELALLLKDAENALKKQLRTSEIQSLSNHLQKDINLSMSLAFTYRLTEKPELGQQLEATLKGMPLVLSQLQVTLNNCGYNPKSLDQLSDLIREALEAGQSIREYDPTNRSIAERKKFTRFGAERLRLISERFADIDAFAVSLNSEPRAAIEKRDRVVKFLWLAAAADLSLAVALGAFTIVNIVNRIAVLKQNMQRLALKQPLYPRVGGRDEIFQLDKSFREMAVSLEDSSKRQHALIENAVDVLCSIDRSGNFVSVSSAARKIWGYEPEHLIGKKVSQLLGLQGADEAMLNLSNVIDSKIEKSFETRIVKSEGDAVEMRWSVIWSEKDQNLFCVVRDVSRDNELARMKQVLIDTAAHDLRAPLTSIVATLNNLAIGVLGELSPNAQAKVEKTEEQAKRLVRLVSDLLDEQNLSTGNMGFSRTPTHITSVIDEAVSLLGTLTEKKRIRVLAATLPTSEVFVDRDRVLQVMINILSNAIKFSPPSSTINITANLTGEFMTVEVSDQGPGIPDERKSLVFQRFNQVADNRRLEEGSGLGLSIAKTIVERHGGTIGVRDHVGGGSVFWFTLPGFEPNPGPVL